MAIHAFLSALPEPGRSRLERAPDLKRVLGELTASARATWPEVDLPEEAFWPILAQRLPAGASSAKDLYAIKVEDLYLASACARNDPTALASFEKAYLGDIHRQLDARLCASLAEDELRQLLRVKLLLPRGEAPPRISTYTGAGALRPWVRMAALRVLLDVRRTQQRRPESLSVELASLPAARLDPELELVDASCRAEFEAALTEAVAGMDVHSRRLLRQHYLGRLTLEQIATITKLHRVTIARQLARARTQLLKGTRASLSKRLRLSPPELQSLVAAAISRLDVNMAALLKTCETL